MGREFWRTKTIENDNFEEQEGSMRIILKQILQK
jgi:hypothetical protein